MAQDLPPAHPEALPDADALRRLGARLRELRRDRGWSQQVLADRADVSPKHLGEVERGVTDASATVLVKIARGLDVPVGELFRTITPYSAPHINRETLAMVRESIGHALDSVEASAAPDGAAQGTPRYQLRRPPAARPRQRRSTT